MAEKRHISAGLIAHVDAGKTTLSEALLYSAGVRRTLGRVDHGDAYLDTHELERSRGITIFSKQARLETARLDITLVDTPGHVDFAAEAERSLPILDCAILVISGTDGVQAHTVTLWRLLERYQVPTFLFINKMDLAGADRSRLMAQLQQELGSGCVDFTAEFDEIAENCALCDEALLEEYLETGTVTQGNLRGLIAGRKVFPCCFGSALKLRGVEEFLDLLDTYAPEKQYADAFGAKVYKISRDPQGNRLSWLKITGGSLKNREAIRYVNQKSEEAEEKIIQIRLYTVVGTASHGNFEFMGKLDIVIAFIKLIVDFFRKSVGINKSVLTGCTLTGNHGANLFACTAGNQVELCQIFLHGLNVRIGNALNFNGETGGHGRFARAKPLGSFGNGRIQDADLAAALQGAVVKDENKDSICWNKLHGLQLLQMLKCKHKYV